MRAFCAFLEGSAAAIGAALVFAFTIIILADVACRYWLKIPLSWVTEFTVFLFQLTCLAGAVIALRRGMHFGLGLLVRDVWPKASRALRPIVALAVAGAALLLGGLAIKMANQAWNSMYTTLPISQATVYIVMAISAAAMAILALEPLVTGEDAKIEGVGE